MFTSGFTSPSLAFSPYTNAVFTPPNTKSKVKEPMPATQQRQGFSIAELIACAIRGGISKKAFLESLPNDAHSAFKNACEHLIQNYHKISKSPDPDLSIQRNPQLERTYAQYLQQHYKLDFQTVKAWLNGDAIDPRRLVRKQDTYDWLIQKLGYYFKVLQNPECQNYIEDYPRLPEIVQSQYLYEVQNNREFRNRVYAINEFMRLKELIEQNPVFNRFRK